MPSEGPELLAIRQRLNAVVRCVLAHAEKDAEFAADLAQSLMGDARPQPRATRRPPDLNLVEALKDRGEEELVQQLGKLATSELQHLAQHYEAAPPKQAKAMARDDLITCLVAKAHQRLGRGREFIKPTSASGVEDRAADEAQTIQQTDDAHAAELRPAEPAVGAERAELGDGDAVG